MNDMTPAMGHNNPPDPIDQITAQFEAERLEAENWTDGTPVENEAQMNAVDALRKSMRAMRLALENGQKSAAAPLFDAHKAEVARWKPTITDAKRIEDCLVAAVDGFKRKLAAEKAEKERLAREAEAEALRQSQEAAEAARENPADLEAQRAADAAAHEAEQARIRAAIAAKDGVKGMRAYDVTEVLDGTAYARWLWANDREWLLGQMQARATACRHHVPGVVETRQERRAA